MLLLLASDLQVTITDRIKQDEEKMSVHRQRGVFRGKKLFYLL